MRRTTWKNVCPKSSQRSSPGNVTAMELATIALPATAAELFTACEVHCVAGCCGLDAFDFDPKYVAEWLACEGGLKGLKARDELQCAINELSSEQEWVCLADINHSCTRKEAASWLSMMLGFLHESGVQRDLEWREPQVPPVDSRPPWEKRPPTVAHPNLISDGRQASPAVPDTSNRYALPRTADTVDDSSPVIVQASSSRTGLKLSFWIIISCLLLAKIILFVGFALAKQIKL